MHDTTRQPEGELAALRTVFELVRQPALVVDARSGRIVDANPAACEAAGAVRDELIGRSWRNAAALFPRTTLRELGGGAPYFVAVAGEPAADRCSAQHDTLTGLANREVLAARITADQNGQRRKRIGILFVDLDGFKRVNDTWGHAVGDRVLRAVAERLSDRIRPSDVIVRYGGDEFLVIVEGLGRRRDLERLARRVARAVKSPILVDGREIVLSASVGIAQRNSRLTTLEALIAEADRAMYRAKAVRHHTATARRGTPQNGNICQAV